MKALRYFKVEHGERLSRDKSKVVFYLALVEDGRTITTSVFWDRNKGYIQVLTRTKGINFPATSFSVGVGLSKRYRELNNIRDFLWHAGGRNGSGYSSILLATNSCSVCGRYEPILRMSGKRKISNIEAAHPTIHSYDYGVSHIVPLCHFCHTILDSGDDRRISILEHLNNQWLERKG